MAKNSTERSHTTVTVRREVHDRLRSLKEYDSMSYNELLTELADAYDRRGEDE